MIDRERLAYLREKFGRKQIGSKPLDIGYIYNNMLKQGVSWRKCGVDGQSRRPMFHRFPIKSGETVASIFAESVTKSNELLKVITRKGRLKSDSLHAHLRIRHARTHR